MDVEIAFAVEFLLWFFQDLAVEKLEELAYGLTEILRARYTEHWYPEQPSKGSGYRCIDVIESGLDPTLVEALRQCQWSTKSASWNLPDNLSLWVDPNEVSYRFGDWGPVELLYQGDIQSSAAYEQSFAWENYSNQTYTDYYTDQEYPHYYGQYYMSSGVSYDAQMDNNDSEFFTYRGEVFNRRVWTEQWNATSQISSASFADYTPSSYTTASNSYGSPPC